MVARTTVSIFNCRGPELECDCPDDVDEDEDKREEKLGNFLARIRAQYALRMQ